MAEESLQLIDKGLYCLNSHFVIWGRQGSIRMTAIETKGGLILYSPVALSPAQLEQIARLGAVSAIVAPNLFHHLYLRPCIASFPNARVLVPEGLAEKIGPIPGAEVMTDDAPIFGVDGEIDHAVFKGHRLRETVLFHRPTQTLITADLLYNFQPENTKAEKLFFRAIGCYGSPSAPFYHRFAVEDKASVKALIAHVQRWGARRVIMSHGRIIENQDCSAIFADVWARFAI
jgi:hypothetical protein